MIEEELVTLYKKVKKQLATLLDDATFANFYRALQSGKREFTFKNTQINKTIDEEWVNAIAKAIPNIDAIVNNPRRYMRRETEVVPIEKAKIVDSESVKHLASHTNYINNIENGNVRPNKILTAYHEETLDIYENRFVMTLVNRLSQFIDRRYFLLGTGGNEFSSSISINGTFEQAGEITNYANQMTVNQGAEYFDGGVSSKVYENLFMARKYVNSFKYSPFMKEMSNFSDVRPPIVNTNLLSKEPNYRACVELWDFIESYSKAGYKIEVTESAPNLDRDVIDDFDAADMMQYLVLKRKMGDFDKRRKNMEKCDKRTIEPTIEEYEALSNESFDSKIVHGSRGELVARDQSEMTRAMKEIILKALRKESVKYELERVERENQEKTMKKALEDAINKEKADKEAAEKQREGQIKDVIREALRAEKQEAAAYERARAKRERKVEGVLSRELEYIREDEREKKRLEAREARSQEELYSAVIADMLALEQEREYIEISPVVLYGHERMPVPIANSQNLPAPQELIEQLEKFEKDTEPPLSVTPDEWLEMKYEAKKLRLRHKIAESKVLGAIEDALNIENKKRKRELYEKRQEEHRILQAQLAELNENIMELRRQAAGLCDEEQDKLTLPLTQETIPLVSDKKPQPEKSQDQKPQTEKPQPEESPEKAQEKELERVQPAPKEQDERDEHSRKSGGAKKSHKFSGKWENSGEVPRNKSLSQTEEEKEGFWHKVFRILFGWLKK